MSDDDYADDLIPKTDLQDLIRQWQDAAALTEVQTAEISALFGVAKSLWRIIRDHFNYTDTDLIGKLEEYKTRIRLPDQTRTVTCAGCGRTIRVHDSLLAVCIYCGTVPDLENMDIPFDGRILFTLPAERYASETAYSISGMSETENPDEPYNSLKINRGDIRNYANECQQQKNTHQLQQLCIDAFSIFELLRSRTGTSVRSLRDEVVRMTEAKKDPQREYEYLYTLLESIWKTAKSAASLPDKLLSEEIAVVSKETEAQKEQTKNRTLLCPVCQRMNGFNVTGVRKCIYCGAQISQNPIDDIFDSSIIK